MDERLTDSSFDSITIATLLSKYSKVCGMTGTADKEAFREIYHMDTIDIPKNADYQYRKKLTSKKPAEIIENPNTKIPELIILLLSASLSNGKRKIASAIFKVKNGTNTVQMVNIKSIVPYSVVVNIFVYNVGKNGKTSLSFLIYLLSNILLKTAFINLQFILLKKFSKFGIIFSLSLLSYFKIDKFKIS